jgi:O-antigen/teichoic acid export membrane protein
VLKKNIIANYIGQFINAIMSFAFIPTYIKYLGVESYALIGIFSFISSWFSLLDMGMTPTLNREMAIYNINKDLKAINLLRSFEIISTTIAIIIILIIYLSSDWIAVSWLKKNNLPIAIVSKSFILIGIVTSLRFIESIYKSCLVGLQRQVLLNIINSSFVIIRNLGAIFILLFVSKTIIAFFIWQAIVSFFSIITLFFTIYKNLKVSIFLGKFSKSSISEIKKFAGGMILITILSLLLMQIDKILLSKMLSLKDFGYYTISATVSGALFMLLTPITQAFFPQITACYATNNKSELNKIFHNAAQLVTVVIGSASLVLIFFSNSILLIWTNDVELANKVSPIVQILILGNLLNGLMYLPYETQIAHGWTSLTIKINIIQIIIFCPLIFIIAPIYGAKGVAFLWLLINMGYIFIGVHFMFNKILKNQKFHWYLYDIFLPILAALIPCLIFSAYNFYYNTNFNKLLLIIGASFFSILSSALFTKYTRQIIYIFFINKFKFFAKF